MRRCQTQHTLLFSILISCDNSDEYFHSYRMWNVGRIEEARPCGECHKYLFFADFNGYALLGLCVRALHGNRSKESQAAQGRVLLSREISPFYFISQRGVLCLCEISRRVKKYVK